MTPLHQAVIEDHLTELEDRAFVEKWRDFPDRFGFTALEIAQYLGKYEAMRQLGGKLPCVFKALPNGAKKAVELSFEGFEKAFGIRYRPFLTFDSYAAFTRVLQQCPYILLSRYLASENYAWGQKYHSEISSGATAAMIIQWIDPTLGYGAFAAEDLFSGEFIGEYTGIVRQLYRRHPNHNPYCFHYPTKLWSLNYFTIDSMKEGNLTRFINHSTQPNLQPLCTVDRGLLHLVLVANREIKKGEQLTFDYGEDYWLKRKSARGLSHSKS